MWTLSRCGNGSTCRMFSIAPAAQLQCPSPCPAIPGTRYTPPGTLSFRPSVQNVADLVMADFTQRTGLHALVCGESGRQITYDSMLTLSRQVDVSSTPLLCLLTSGELVSWTVVCSLGTWWPPCSPTVRR